MINQATISKGFSTRPHVVLLGAGASVAALPKGDKYGLLIPTMNNIIEVLGLNKILSEISLENKSSDLEIIFSELSENPENASIKEQIEINIFKYFSSLTISDEPTIYDLLLLSLKSKDCIATFNWDDLILQSWQRVAKIVGRENMPKLIFLHGNVGVGYCTNDLSLGSIHSICKYCKSRYKPTKLLYPVENKNYKDQIINVEWEKLTHFLNNASIITIFGYRCPDTDIEARELLLRAFDCFNSEKRFLDQIEIIDKPGLDKGEIIDRWSDFIKINQYHYEIFDSFFESELAKAPRRSTELVAKKNIDGWWGSSSIYFDKRVTSFEELNDLIIPLLKAEAYNDFSIV